jgi:large subunit ribosomal protein L21
MYAVVDNGGKQYRVEAGTTLVIDRLDAEAGASVTFDRVLLIGDEDGVTVGTPTVAGASVHGTVVAHGRGPKIIVFRFRPKAHYRRRTGHRSELTQVRIDEIATAGGRSKTATAEKAPAAEKKAAPRRKPAAKVEGSKADAPKAATKAPTKPATKRRSAPAKKAAAAATED